MSDAGTSYRRVAAHEPIVSPAEEADLVAAMRAGQKAAHELRSSGTGPHRTRELNRLVDHGVEARDRLLRAHLRLVLSIARRYEHPAVELDDLVQAGNRALIEAANLFPDRGRGRFSAYARGRVRTEIARCAQEAAVPLSVPQRVLDQVRSLRVLLRDASDSGRVLTVLDVAADLRVSQAQAVRLLQLAQPYVLLSTPIGSETFQLGDTLYVRHELDISSDWGEVTLALEQLPFAIRRALTSREAEVVLRRHGLFEGGATGAGQTFQDIGRALGISGEGARKIYSRARMNLRESEGLQGYRTLTFPREGVAPDEIASWFGA